MAPGDRQPGDPSRARKGGADGSHPPGDTVDGVGGSAGGERLQKVLAAAGVGSRRRCEELIESGAVKVNGRRVDGLPVFVDPAADRVEVGGKALETKPERHVYVMLHKPRHTLTTLEDPEGRRTIADVVKHPSGVRLYPVGRLDFDTMGLLVLTNDGPLANRLTHPRYEVHKTYRAIVKGRVEDEDVAKLEDGIYLALRKEGRTVGASRTGGAELTVVKRDRNRTILDITLTEGRNRQVRRMLANVGHHVKKLTRTSMGPLRLKGLRLGEWRELTPGEVRSLRIAAGLMRGRGGTEGSRGS